jgi:hypothetical protein
MVVKQGSRRGDWWRTANYYMNTPAIRHGDFQLSGAAPPRGGSEDAAGAGRSMGGCFATLKLNDPAPTPPRFGAGKLQQLGHSCALWASSAFSCTAESA